MTQAFTSTVTDPRHFGTYFYEPAKKLWQEASQITAPFKGASLEAQFAELVGKVIRVFSLALTPIVLIAVGFGCVNLLAHFINPLQAQEKAPSPPVVPAASVVPVVDFSLQIPALIDKVQQLQQDYDKIYTDVGFHGLRGENRKELLNRFIALRGELDLVKNEPGLGTLYKSFIELEDQFRQVIRKRHELINAPIRMTNGGRIPAPDKGNCFYEAAVVSLRLYNCLPSPNLEESALEYNIQPAELRRELIQWERDHINTDQIFKGFVDAGIDVYLQDKQNEIDEKELTVTFLSQDPSQLENETFFIKKEIEELKKLIMPYQDPENRFSHYFEMASQNGFWGGLPEFYALAKRYDVCILVREDNKGVIKDPSLCYMFNEESSRRMQIWWIDGHHFENRMD
jgi:hypothetical protein